MAIEQAVLELDEAQDRETHTGTATFVLPKAPPAIPPPELQGFRVVNATPQCGHEWKHTPALEGTFEDGDDHTCAKCLKTIRGTEIGVRGGLAFVLT